ncbi:amidohydrolase family protein [Terrarubrum flagellatum]|uniref:amidohydrolase family protein n=1 Tax=Terrirubrum flagellatum TaxID=2895980 RepID=UPI003144EDAF
MQIDAHQHFWRISRGDYWWLRPDLAGLYRDFVPSQLKPHLRKHGIERTILVQAAPTIAETQFMLDLAREADFVAGVVGWVDFAAPDAAKIIDELAKDELLVGLRPMVQDIADDDWLLRADLARAVDAMQAHGLVFDALTLPRHLSRLLVFIDRHPGLALVIDHCSKPHIRDRRYDPWRADMAAVAARPHVMCKLSGLATEASADWSAADLKTPFRHVLDMFGANRLIWGSDWPVVNLAGGYDRWRETALDLLAPLGAQERAAILGGNAQRLYLSKRGRRP